MIMERPVAAHVLTIQPFVLDEMYSKVYGVYIWVAFLIQSI